MRFDLWSSYSRMLKSRLLEEAIARLWQDGLISGEMHLGTGEEAIIAGIVPQLVEGDAMALDHRGTSALLLRGVDPVLILHELLGRPDGLCGGMGGHMHLFSKEYLAASSGIVGAVGPTATGFAMSAQVLHTQAITVAFFGEGALNQGMMMEALNLAAVWKLPILFVCKDDSWSITTSSSSVSGGDPLSRARSLGIQAVDVDGRQVSDVWQAAQTSIQRLRAGEGPLFLHVRCVHLEGHFLGYQLIRMVRHPLRELPRVVIPLTTSFLHPGGAAFNERLAGVKIILGAVLDTLRDPRRDISNDPLYCTRLVLQPDARRLQELEDQAKQEIGQVVEVALAGAAR